MAILEHESIKMMTTPFFSVILCFYNARDYLEDAIKSILSQSFKDFEIILVDDGSTDSGYELAEKLCKGDQRIRLFKKDSSGLTDSLNYAINQSHGKFMIRHDADDISTPDRLKKICDNIQPGIDFYFSKSREFGNSSRTFPGSRYKNGFCQSVMQFGNFIAHGSIALRMSVAKELLYDTSWKYAQDFELYTRLISKGHKGFFINETLYYLRTSDNSISARKKNEQLQLCQKALKKNFGIAGTLIANTTGFHKLSLIARREASIFISLTRKQAR